MNKVYRQATAYIILCSKHDNLRVLKNLLSFAWNTSLRCSVCRKEG